MSRKKKKAGVAPKRAAGDVDLGTIERLVRLMNENDLYELEVVSGPDHKVRLSRRPPGALPVYAPPMATSMHGMQMHAGPPAPSHPSASEAPAKASDATEFLSPMVGTFYRAPAPEAPPYVNIGDTVGADTVICLIEAMKVMNEIKAETAGKIVDILVENGEAVEFGQPLFLIKKS